MGVPKNVWAFRYQPMNHISVDFRESHETVEFLIGL
jgi:hypothetical protein